MRLRSLLLLLLSWVLLGCSVVDRAKRCQEMAAAVRQAAPALEATPIERDPSPKELRKKARLYGQLSSRVKAIQVEDPQVAKQQEAFVGSLEGIERHLNDAAEAVEGQEQLDERQGKPKRKDAKARPSQQVEPKDPAKPGPRTPHRRIAPTTRHTLHFRRYERARRAAENAVKTMETTSQRLSEACQ